MQLTLTEKQLHSYFLDGQDDLAIEVFLEYGPEGLQDFLGISKNRPDVWKSIYDYFLFEKGVLKIAAQKFQRFLVDVVGVYGPLHIRKMFHIEAQEYDKLFRDQLLDLLVVQYKGVVEFALRNRRQLSDKLHSEGSESVRRYLTLVGANYDETWREVLDLLLDVSFQDLFQKRRKIHVMEFFRGVRALFRKSVL